MRKEISKMVITGEYKKKDLTKQLQKASYDIANIFDNKP